MIRAFRTSAAVLAAIALAGPALAESHASNPAQDARNSHMNLYGFNLGVLGAMAKGDTEFDATIAQEHAANLVALSGMSEHGYWVEGTASGELADSRALPAIWENMDDFMAKSQALHEAAMAIDASSLEGVQAGVGQLGGACGACHKVYRQPD